MAASVHVPENYASLLLLLSYAEHTEESHVVASEDYGYALKPIRRLHV